MKILINHLSGFVEYAITKGMPQSELQSIVNVQELRLNKLNGRISENVFYNIIRKIASFLNDDLLGLRVGEQLNLNTLGVVYQISLKATSLLEALHYCHDYLQNTFPPISIKRTSKNATYTFTLKMSCQDEEVCRYILETILTVMCREIMLTSGDETAVTIYSPHWNKEYPSHWKKANVYKVTFKAGEKKRKTKFLIGFELDILIPEYLAIIEEIGASDSFVTKVKISALRMARPKLPDIKLLAFNLNMKTRTLQRKLMSEGSSFREISEELKRNISNHLLLHRELSIADISSILGYSEPASYIRSFIKWDGHSPGYVRDRQSRRFPKKSIDK
jgi:AraC-like DNA-binding protein